MIQLGLSTVLPAVRIGLQASSSSLRFAACANGVMQRG